MSPEGRGVFANFSVRENLQMGAYLKKNKREIAADMERAFKMFPRLKEREVTKSRARFPAANNRCWPSAAR